MRSQKKETGLAQFEREWRDATGLGWCASAGLLGLAGSAALALFFVLKLFLFLFFRKTNTTNKIQTQIDSNKFCRFHKSKLYTTRPPYFGKVENKIIFVG